MLINKATGSMAFQIVGVMQDHDGAGGDDSQCVEMVSFDPDVLQFAGSEDKGYGSLSVGLARPSASLTELSWYRSDDYA